MEPQADVLAFLGAPASHGGPPVERIDTHISAVFLAGERAIKLKKAVRLPFLDFSTPEARHAACAAELEINRRAAPDLYLGIEPVVRRPDGALAMGGDGDVLDWVVIMRRFDQAGLYDRLIRQDPPPDRDEVHRLTEAVFAFHQSAPPRPDKGGAAGLAWTIDTNRQSMERHADVLDPAAVARLADLSRAALARARALVEARRAEGRVRRCHGDLHLGNICRWRGEPTLFDAIEFSEDIACIDVIYDMAFLLMDLDHRGRRRMASWVMNHYLDLSGDYAGMAPLPLYLSLRAGVRAHVAATMAAGAEAVRRDGLQSDARAHLTLALDYLAPPAPRLLAVGGLSGSGKSRMGRELSPLLGVPGAVVVRTDALRKQIMGVPIHQRLGPDGYTHAVTERTYQALYDTCAGLLAAGRPAVADAVFALPEQRAAIEAVAARAGVRFDGLWLDVPPDLAAARIAKRKANISDATPAVLERQLGYDLGAITWTSIDSSPPKAVTLQAGKSALGL